MYYSNIKKTKNEKELKQFYNYNDRLSIDYIKSVFEGSGDYLEMIAHVSSSLDLAKYGKSYKNRSLQPFNPDRRVSSVSLSKPIFDICEYIKDSYMKWYNLEGYEVFYNPLIGIIFKKNGLNVPVSTLFLPDYQILMYRANQYYANCVSLITLTNILKSEGVELDKFDKVSEDLEDNRVLLAQAVHDLFLVAYEDIKSYEEDTDGL